MDYGYPKHEFTKIHKDKLERLRCGLRTIASDQIKYGMSVYSKKEDLWKAEVDRRRELAENLLELL